MPEIYQTIMINFGYIDVYTGDDLEAAKQAAIETGFECHVQLDGAFVMAYSPISGWRK